MTRDRRNQRLTNCHGYGHSLLDTIFGWDRRCTTCNPALDPTATKPRAWDGSGRAPGTKPDLPAFQDLNPYGDPRPEPVEMPKHPETQIYDPYGVIGKKRLS